MAADPEELRIAVVGAGSVATKVHLPAWQRQAGAHVAWVVDSNEQAARDAAEHFGIRRWTTDMADLAQADDVDALDLCTPAARHAEHAIEALKNGRHVLVEKPLAENSGTAEQMAAAAFASPAVAMVAENWVYSSGFRWARELLRSGAIGSEIYMLEAIHETDFALRDRSPSGSDPGRLGYFAVTGPHVISVARHLIGELASLAAYGTPAPADPRTGRLRDHDVAVSAQFASGPVATFRFSGRVRHDAGPVRSVRVIGSGGWARFDPFSDVREWADKTGTYRAQQESSSAGHAEAIATFVACCRDGDEPLTSFSDQAGTVAVVDAVYESLSSAAAVVLAPGVRS